MIHIPAKIYPIAQQGVVDYPWTNDRTKVIQQLHPLLYMTNSRCGTQLGVQRIQDLKTAPRRRQTKLMFWPGVYEFAG